MNQHLVPDPPAPGALPLTTAVRWTPERQRLFLAALLATGNVTQAARAAGMSAASAHRLRRRLAGTPFDRAWAGALVLHAQSLADPFAARRPASPERPTCR
ncbi:MAG: LysR family transcriptional regulator [Pseudomonadota bacterium]|uniref:LysR family transcriptional regulator n=1 Tax=Sphingobium sp. TaxID=1912891 RepID=UPI002E1CD2FF